MYLPTEKSPKLPLELEHKNRSFCVEFSQSLFAIIILVLQKLRRLDRESK